MLSKGKPVHNTLQINNQIPSKYLESPVHPSTSRNAKPGTTTQPYEDDVIPSQRDDNI